MKVNVRVLGWTDKCCGCSKDIKSTDKVFIIGNIVGVPGTIHLCQSCINNISNSNQVKE